MKKFYFKYPKIAGLILAIIFAYFIFRNPIVRNFISNLDGGGNFGIFIAGMGYTFGFTSPFSTGFFLTLNTKDILFSGIIAGLGAMFADLVIFRFARFSFADEFHKLRDEGISIRLKEFMRKIAGKRTRKILLYIFACILIASPLPDEAGVIILAGLTKIKPKIMAIISFVLNTIGIIIILITGKIT